MIYKWPVIAATFAAMTTSIYCTSPGKAGAEAAYTAERLKCIDDSKTPDAANACDEAVKRKWGTLDGGVQ